MSSDPQAEFTRLWTTAQGVVVAVVASLVPHAADVDDLVQEVALTAHRRFDDYDTGRDFTGWALGIARNVVRSHRRKRRDAQLVDDDAVIDAVVARAEERSPLLQRYAGRLQFCLQRLGERARRLLDRHYREQLDQATVAELEGMSHAAVRTGLHRARVQLRRCIDADEEQRHD